MGDVGDVGDAARPNQAMAEDAAAAAPLAEPKPAPSLTDRLCSSVLSIARAEDDGARITSMAKWEHDDSTLLRVSADAVTMPSIAAALRRRLPLASVGIVEDVMNGTQQAQLLVPSGADQLRRASAMATETRGVVILGGLARALGAAAALVVVAAVVATVAR